jgi:glycosyltransferase involved in cell wall biosynthesis
MTKSHTDSTNISPLLSIIIATRNRQRYAALAADSILRVQDDRIELVIQDNSDEGILETALSTHSGDRRLRYQYTPPPLSMIENFNKAIELSTGEYVCLIGDDDGINPEIVEATAWAKAHGIEALVGSLTANYRWAGTGAPDTLFTKMTDSTLVLNHFSGETTSIDVEDSLRKFARAGFTYYLHFPLPKLYHGIVKRECLNEILRRNGAYIRGLSPDIYLSIALACIGPKLVKVDYPLTIPGVCPESGSIIEGQIRRHSRRLADAPHLRSNPSYVWSEEVPSIYCVETIWTDSALHAVRDMNRADLMLNFDRYQMYANIINANRDSLRDCLTHLHSLTQHMAADTMRVLVAYISGPILRFVRMRAISRLLIIVGFKRLEEIGELSDIGAATDALLAHLKALPKGAKSPPFKISTHAK